MWGALILAVFLYAYFFGAVFKMLAFGVGHEISHETVHPWITVGDAAGSGLQKRDGWWAVRRVLKDIALRVCTLPSVDHTIFEYYHNQHLAHHRFLGGQDISDALTGIVNGSQLGDGDQFAVVGLQQHQRQIRSSTIGVPLDDDPKLLTLVDMYNDGYLVAQGEVEVSDDASMKEAMLEALRIKEVGGYTVPEGKRPYVAFRSLKADFFGANWDSVLNSPGSKLSLVRFFARHSTVGKFLLDPAFHIAHWGMTNITMMIHLLALLYTIPAAFMGYVMPESIYNKIRLTYLPHREVMQQSVETLAPSSLVGIQVLVKIAVLAWIYSSISVEAAMFVGKGPVFALQLFYLVLSELFVFGFLFHPFLAYFLTVHHSAFNHRKLGMATEDPTNPTAPPQTKDDSGEFVRMIPGSRDGTDSSTGACQPTRSMYGSWWFSLLTMNLTHHVEHHDFPSVPWFYLPTLTGIAPEFYRPGGTVDGEPNGVVAANTDPSSVIYDYLMKEPRQTVYGCGNCT